MITTKGYTTKEAIEQYLATDIDNSMDDRINYWILAMEQYIDNLTGRNFKADEEYITNRYDGNGTNDLRVDDFIELEKIEVGHDVITTYDTEFDDYYVYPANETPKNRIVLYSDIFPTDYQNVAISAKWGYSETPPEDIKLAATILVVGVINYTNKADGEVESVSIGRYQVTYKDEKQWQDFKQVEQILQGYRKFVF